MSNDENSNESVDSVNESEESNSKAVEESTSQAVEESSNTVNNIISKVMELKESNPKVFFGGIGGLV
ncbi:MAG: hypothetical protein GQ532_15080, partial [Methylomarinum sp.]|nr:hypothetical protein [Methylomarinum sp.]